MYLKIYLIRHRYCFHSSFHSLRCIVNVQLDWQCESERRGNSIDSRPTNNSPNVNAVLYSMGVGLYATCDGVSTVALVAYVAAFVNDKISSGKRTSQVVADSVGHNPAMPLFNVLENALHSA